MTAIQLDNVSKQFGKVLAVDELSAEIHAGEVVGVVGPSGSGKSTLLRLVAGLESPSTGDIQFNGHSVLDVRPADRHVGMVFQDFALFPHMTCAENIRSANRNSAASAVDFQNLIRRLQLQDVLERYPHQLSGGERQRTALARCLAQRPQVYLFDEPVSNLDALTKRDSLLQIADITAQHAVTTLFVSHVMDDVRFVADRILVMRSGRLQQIGSYQELLSQPSNRFVAAFCHPEMNFLLGELSGDLFSIGRMQIQLPNRYDFAGPAWLGIEADAIALESGDVGTVIRVQHAMDADWVLVYYDNQHLVASQPSGALACDARSVQFSFDLQRGRFFAFADERLLMPA
ncbi:MAG: ABC transporter ATP-binding protein [Planctomycetales bacterium]|nr:ABC transporter ATP-binding protein [Planctomycetales bacterium]